MDIYIYKPILFCIYLYIIVKLKQYLYSLQVSYYCYKYDLDPTIDPMTNELQIT